MLTETSHQQKPVSFATQLVGGFVVAANADRPFESAEWQTLVDTARTVGETGQRVNILVFSAGSGPTTMQRAQLNVLAKTYSMRIAVVTGSQASRVAIKALSWLAKVDVKGFDPDELDAAFGFLEIPRDLIADVKHALSAVKRTLRIS